MGEKAVAGEAASAAAVADSGAAAAAVVAVLMVNVVRDLVARNRLLTIIKVKKRFKVKLPC